MSTLSALGASTRSSQVPGAGDSSGQGRSTGTDFASLMANDPGTAPAPKPKPNVAQEAQDKNASRPDRSEAPSASDSQDTPSDKANATGQARSAEAGERARATDDTAKTAAKPSDARTVEHEDEQDDAWPPAGLAGFGMAVLPVLTTALPGAVAAPLQAAGLVMNLAGTAARGVAGLLVADAGAAGTATAAANPAAAGSSAEVANGSFTGLLAQASAATKTATTDAAPMAALAALAGAGDKQVDDAGAVAGTDPLNLLAGLAPTPASRAVDGSTPFSASPTPTPDLHSDMFDDALGARMSWLADQKIGHAHIKISPADLGPIEVRLHLNGDQVNASFSSAQAEVRHALENSLPRLRDMLGQHGFQLGQADVGQQQQQASQGGQPSSGGQRGNPADDDLQAPVGIPAAVLRQRGLVDAYA